jgi:hypothetical protein
MRSRNFVAAVVVAMGVATAMATAPAGAEPQGDPVDQDEQLDQAFLNAIREKGVRVETDRAAISLAHSTCDLLHRGGSVNDALRHVKNATDWSMDDITAFAGVAVYAYCRDKTPK